MKCRECPDYTKCVKESNLAIKRKNCPKAKTEKVNANADRIRAMSDEELAEWIHNGISSDACDYCEYNNGYCDGSPCHGKAEAEIITDWLKQPVSGEKEKSDED